MALEFPDNVEEIKNEERSIRLVGTAIYRAFREDRVLRDELNPVVAEMSRRGRAYRPTRQDFFADAFNSFIVEAYHCSRAAEELARFARDYREDSVQFNLLMQVQHSFGPTAVFELQHALDLLTRPVVQESLGLVEKELRAIWNCHFPDLKDARNALAHDAERYMKYKGKKRIESAHRQMKGQFGSKLGSLTDGDFVPLGIDVGSERIIALVVQLRHHLPPTNPEAHPQN